MESFNSIQSSERLPQLMDQINETCNALISALEVNSQAVGEYGGSVAHQISTEYVDILIKNLLKIKYHLSRLQKELNTELVTSSDDVKNIISGLLNTMDAIDEACLNDGYLRNQFSFATDELKNMITEMINEMELDAVYA